MSKVALSPNASGTGTFTIAAPNSNSDRTLTLPDATGTLNVSGASNEVPAGSSSAPAIYPTGDTNTGIFFPAADTIAFAEGGAEVARFDSSGNLLVGTTVGGSSAARGIELSAGAGNETYVRIRHEAAATSGGWFIGFQYNNNVIGNITQNGTTAVAYNTTSDYRLKENVQPMTGALAKVAALKPCTYKWKADGSEAEGFIAHELAEVVPQCVSGEKDAVDAEGNPQYQGIDTSFLVATLTAAIQEQQAIIESLTARVAALEGQA